MTFSHRQALKAPNPVLRGHYQIESGFADTGPLNNSQYIGKRRRASITNYVNEYKLLIMQWRKEYNQIRSNNAKNYHPPVPEAIQTMGNYITSGTTSGGRSVTYLI
jgi:hypothetical protein